VRFIVFARDVLPMVSIIGMVIVLIMAGIATPSEAAAYGSVGVILLAIIYLFLAPLAVLAWLKFVRRASSEAAATRLSQCRDQLRGFTPAFGKSLWKSMWGAGRVTVIALVILLGSSLFSNVLAASGASVKLIEWVTSFNVSGYVMLLMMIGILLLLGMFMDQLAMMLLTVPIFFPVIAKLQFGLPLEVTQIWFGVIMLLAMEISFTTPPFGLLLFVMQGVAPPGTRFSEICLAAIPFMACAMTLVALIIMFPDIATWLPWAKF
jgi:TRAP-type C4-dicarboxylate transport system permease large subunit